jgi:transcriptional regulator GlxA family with amidase domain
MSDDLSIKSGSESLRLLLDEVLPQSVIAREPTIIHAAASAVASGGNARDLALVLQMQQRTLLRKTIRASLPPPRRLLAWLRVLLAAKLLQNSHATLSSVARSCGYSSDPALRRAIREFLAVIPSELRTKDAFSATVRRFEMEIEAHCKTL